MIEKVQLRTFQYISSLFDKYGIPFEFKYDPNLDVLNEFRRSIRLRVENKEVFESLLSEYDDDNKKYTTNLGIFNRSPIRKSRLLGNNIDLETFCRDYSSKSDIELRSTFFGEVTFNVKLLFDSHDISDIVELIYLDKLANQQKSFKLDFSLGENIEPIEEVGYSLLFSDIDFLGSINSSNLRQLDFSVELSGLFFLPFYKSGGLLEEIIVDLHIYNRSTPIDPSDIKDHTRVYQKSFIMERD